MSDSAIWAGVVGAAVGAGFGFGGAVLQGVITRREGRDARAHDRAMRLADSRSAAYVSVIDYCGRLAGWYEGIQAAAAAATAPGVFLGATVMWTGEEWYSMMAGLRAFGTRGVLDAFISVHETGSGLNDLLKRSAPKGNVTAGEVLVACTAIHNAIVSLHKLVTAEIQDDVGTTTSKQAKWRKRKPQER